MDLAQLAHIQRLAQRMDASILQALKTALFDKLNLLKRIQIELANRKHVNSYAHMIFLLAISDNTRDPPTAPAEPGA